MLKETHQRKAEKKLQEIKELTKKLETCKCPIQRHMIEVYRDMAVKRYIQHAGKVSLL